MGEAAPLGLVQRAVGRLNSLSPPFGERDRRATELSQELPHAAEILGLYRAVLAEQARLYEWARTFSWRDPASRPEEETTLILDELPMRTLERRFASFCESLRRSGTDLLAAAGLSLSRSSSIIYLLFSHESNRAIGIKERI